MNRSARFPRAHLLIVPVVLLLLSPATLAAGDDAELVDVTSSTISEEFVPEFLDDIPNGRSWLDAVSMMPGVAGLEEPFRRGIYNPVFSYRDLFHVHGWDASDNTFFVDGVETTNVTSGRSSMAVPWEAIEAVEVLTGGLPAEYGRATGGVVNVVTRSGGNIFHGSLPIYYTDHNLAQDQDEDSGAIAESDFRELEWGGSLGGPVVRDHLWFFGAYNRFTHTLKSINPENEIIEREDVFQEGLLNLTWQVNDNNKLRAQYAHSPAEWDYFDSPCPDVPAIMKTGDRLWKLEWTGIFTPNLFLEAQVARHDAYYSLGPEHGDFQTPRFVDYQNGMGITASGNIASINDVNRPRTQYQATLDWYRSDWAGEHSFKFGAEYMDLEYENEWIYPDVYTINRPYSEPDSWIERTDIEYVDTGSILTIFAQDSWTWREDWTFNLGLRWEQQEQKNDVGEQVYKFDNLISPRLGVAWDVSGDGRSRLFAHLGRFYDAVGLQLASSLNRQVGSVWMYEGDYETGDWTSLYFMTDMTNPNQVDGDLEPNYKDEGILGYEFEFLTDFVGSARAIYNRQNNMIEDVLLNEDEIRRGENTTANYTYYITNVESARRDYRGLELSVKKRLSNNYQFLAVFTLSESKGSVVYDQYAEGLSVYADFEEMKYNRYGNLPWDDEQYLKLNGSYHLPLGFIVGASLNWHSGRPFNRIDPNMPEEAWNFGYTRQYYLDPRGSHRLGSVWWLDLRLRKDFEIGPTMLSLTADAFNLTNNQHVTGRYEIDTSNWGEANNWMGAGYFVLGGKLSF